jgi:predicted DNA-binding protein with PD1-like motif
MKIMGNSGTMELVMLALEPGELLLESIQQAIEEKDIRNGTVASGIGTLKNLRYYAIAHTGFPPEHEHFNVELPLELLSVNGTIARSEPHLHVVASCGRDEVYAGHLEPGSEVAYLAEIAIWKCNDLRMCRTMDPDRQINLLGPE